MGGARRAPPVSNPTGIRAAQPHAPDAEHCRRTMSVMTTTSALFKGVKGLPRKIFGSRNDRLLKTYRRRVGPIGDWESELRGDYDERFAERVREMNPSDPPDEEQAVRLCEIRVELSTDLLDLPEALGEFVIVHELVHLLAPNHGRLFKSFMYAYLPDWEERQHYLQNLT